MNLTATIAATASVVLAAFGTREMVLVTTRPFVTWEGNEFTVHLDDVVVEGFLVRLCVVLHGAALVWNSKSFTVTLERVVNGVRQPPHHPGWWATQATVLFRPERIPSNRRRRR